MTQPRWLRDGADEIDGLVAAHKADPKAFYRDDQPSRVQSLMTALDALRSRLNALPNSKN